MVRSGTATTSRPLPFESTCMLPRSPAWRTGVLTPPWCAALGLKCGPALVAAGSLQSPFSWMCTPCSPGAACCTSTMTTTPEALGVTRALPVTLLPLRGSSTAVATAGVETGSGAAAAGVGATTPASAPAAAAAVGAGEGDDAVAQAQARTRSSEEGRMRGPPRRGRRRYQIHVRCRRGSAHQREPLRGARMLASHRRVIRPLQRARDRRPVAVPDGAEVDLAQADHLRRGPGDEDLVRDVELVPRERLLHHLVAEIAGERHDRLAGDPFQDRPRRRREQPALADREDVL